MIRIRHRGNFNKTEKFLNEAQKLRMMEIARPYAKQGVDALSAATPKRSGETAAAWYYTMTATNKGLSIEWSNSVIAGRAPLVILIQYGHGTGTGGYVPPTDFINPAMKPIFDSLSEAIWNEVKRL